MTEKWNYRLKATVEKSKLTSFQRTRNASNENSFTRIQWHGSIQNKVSIGQTPRANLHWFVLDGGRRDADVELIILDDAIFNQILNRAFVLWRNRKIGKLVDSIFTSLVLETISGKVYIFKWTSIYAQNTISWAFLDCSRERKEKFEVKI